MISDPQLEPMVKVCIGKIADANIYISFRPQQFEEWSPPNTPYNIRLYRLSLVIFLETDCSLPIPCNKYLDNTQSPVETRNCILHCRIFDAQSYLQNDPTNGEHQSFIDHPLNLSYITVFITFMHMGQWTTANMVRSCTCMRGPHQVGYSIENSVKC